MKPVLLFAGPSLPPERLPLAGALQPMPPARCGDLIRALHHEPAAIALVDGIFEIAPTVWHKEILAVLERGVPVYGAASLGALRAAELDRLGMIGVGAVYQAYRDGLLESDAAVMVAHAPAELGHRPLTLAQVDAEASLDAAALVPEERAALRRIVRRINFRDRSWATIFAAYAEWAGAAIADRAARAVASAAFSLKQRDVAELIDRLVRDRLVTAEVCAPPRTIFLDRLVSACAA
jgi:hypothetical protein